MKMLELIEQLKAMPEKMEGFNTEGELVVLNTRKLAEALTKSLRNCDIGTEEEQSKRFKKYCALNKDFEWGCEKCPIFPYKIIKCEFIWAQIPYESEAK